MVCVLVCVCVCVCGFVEFVEVSVLVCWCVGGWSIWVGMGLGTRGGNGGIYRRRR